MAVDAFVNTRYWDTIPTPQEFRDHFDSFSHSPMAAAFTKATREDATASIQTADHLAVAAIIDRVEASAQESQDDATAGATLAAS